MSAIAFDDFEALSQQVSEEFGPWSNTIEVNQELIADYGRLSGDNQWIHTDPERCEAESPYGAPIAQGFLTLSLLPKIRPPQPFELTGYRSATNYGSGGMRFLAPVLVGKSIHSRQRLIAVEQHRRGTLLTFEVDIRATDSDKPALLYNLQLLYIA